MAVIKGEDIVAWDVDGEVWCNEYYGKDDGESIPYTMEDLDPGDGGVVLCDKPDCGKRII